jgi:hypothetical protein
MLSSAERAKIWMKNNPERFKLNQKRYRERHFERDREKRNEASRKWRKLHPDKVNKLNKEYREKNRDRLNQEAREWYKNNKDRVKIWHKKNYEKYKEKYKARGKIRCVKCFESWTSYFPKEKDCEICGKKLYFKTNNIKEKMIFDHKTKECSIKSPSTFLRQKFNTEENRKTWESCNFGTLCISCNGFFDSDGRVEWLRKALIYAANR